MISASASGHSLTGHQKMDNQVKSSLNRYLIEGLLLLFVVGCFANTGKSCDFSKVGLWNVCGYSNTTEEECAKRNCCFAPSSFVSSKNLTQSCVKAPDGFEWKNGTCHQYNGTVCLSYLGNRTTGRDVFFDKRYGVSGTEGILKQFIQISHLSVKGSQLCRHLIPAGICNMMLPVCNARSRPELSCREDCDQIHRICSKDIDRFYGALELYVLTQNIDFSHLNIPTCTDFKYSYEYDPKKNESCAFIGGKLPCHSHLVSKTGIIRPSVSRGTYLAKHNCTWTIAVTVGFFVKLTFMEFDIEASSDCSKDYLIIKDGLAFDSPVLARRCGKTLPLPITSSSNEITVQFITDGAQQATGFIINYTRYVPGKTESGLNTTRDAIIIGACAAVVLIGLIVVVVLRRRWVKIQSYKKEEAEKDLEMFTSFTTVRDRIRQDSMQNPLVEALSRLTPEEKPPQCRLDKVEYVKDLGQGQFGKVFQGQYRLGQNTEETSVAVKMLKEGSSAETKDSFIQEVTLMSVLHHENILRLLAVSTEEEPFCMVFEYMVNGDLNAYLRKNDPDNTEEMNKVSLPVGVLVNMAKQIAYGMEYLGGKRFVHRDLATRNCLVGEEFVIKIADFGMSRDVYESDYYRVGGAAMLPIRWMPPEALLYGKFTVESDVYSYGILLWEIFTYALQPFYGYSNDEVVKFIKKGVVLPKPDICPNEVYDTVMTKCWFKDPERRLNFTEIAKRLEGDYDYIEEHAPKKPKKKQNPAYSIPPSLKPERSIEETPKRIPSKKESVGSSSPYVNYQSEKNKQAGTIELRAKDGAFANPLYKNSVIADDLYDRPKSHSMASEEDERTDKTVRLEPEIARNTVTADDLYDRPRSNAPAYADDYEGDFADDYEGGTVPMPVKFQEDKRDTITADDLYDRPRSNAPAHADDLEDDFADDYEGGTVPMPVRLPPGTEKDNSESGYLNKVFEDDDSYNDSASDEELRTIAKKRYVSPSDARRLSRKASKSSSN